MGFTIFVVVVLSTYGVTLILRLSVSEEWQTGKKKKNPTYLVFLNYLQRVKEDGRAAA